MPGAWLLREVCLPGLGPGPGLQVTYAARKGWPWAQSRWSGSEVRAAPGLSTCAPRGRSSWFVPTLSSYVPFHSDVLQKQQGGHLGPGQGAKPCQGPREKLGDASSPRAHVKSILLSLDPEHTCLVSNPCDGLGGTRGACLLSTAEDGGKKERCALSQLHPDRVFFF